jgi:ribosome-associated protein
MALVRFARVDERMPPSPPGLWQVHDGGGAARRVTTAKRVTINGPGMKKKDDLKLQVSEAILACQDKQADNVTVLELEKDSGAFTDYFVMCSGSNSRQIQAIADAVDERLEALGMRVTHAEGYKQAEWVLLDYVDFVVHVFSEKARQFYDLERLWKSAKRLEPAELMAKPKPRRAVTAKSGPARAPTAKAVPRTPKLARKKKA